jgi:hypothetical protein
VTCTPLTVAFLDVRERSLSHLGVATLALCRPGLSLSVSSVDGVWSVWILFFVFCLAWFLLSPWLSQLGAGCIFLCNERFLSFVSKKKKLLSATLLTTCIYFFM